MNFNFFDVDFLSRSEGESDFDVDLLSCLIRFYLCFKALVVVPRV